jgi:hypothetical protein
MHGGASTGPRTPERLQRIARARCMAATRLKIARAAMIRDLKAEAKRLVELI